MSKSFTSLWLPLGLFVVVGLAAIILLPDQIPIPAKLDDPADKAEAIGRNRTAVLAVLGGGLAVIGASINIRSHALTRRGQLTDRYGKAVEQLAHENLAIRMGGIYALEGVARESSEDHPAVIDVLSAFVREPAKGTGSEAATPAQDGEGQSAAGRLATDVQAALTVIGRRDAERDRGGVIQVDLAGADLVGANLTGANLTGASLAGANVDSANLAVVNLDSANLPEEQRESAIFWG